LPISLAFQSTGAQLPSSVWQRQIYAIGNAPATLATNIQGFEARHSIAVNAANEVFAVGSVQRAQGQRSDCLITKYSATGMSLWRRTFENTPRYACYGVAGVNGGAIVAGSQYLLPQNAHDHLLIKLDAAGAEVWRKSLSTGGLSGVPQMLIDPAGNIAVAAHTIAGSDKGLHVWNIDQNGNLRWRSTVSTPGNFQDRLTALEIDPGGNLFLAGWTSNTEMDFMIAKFDANGVEQWRRSAGLTGSNNFVRSIAADGMGGAVVTGKDVSTGVQRWLTIRYDATGTEVWRTSALPHPGGYGEPMSIAFATNGDVYAAGGSYDSMSSLNSSVLIKYDTMGNEVWRRLKTASLMNLTEIAVAVGVAPNNDIVVTGQSHGVSSIYDFRTVRYKPNGDEVFGTRTDLPGNSNDVPLTLFVGPDSNIVIGGNTDPDFGTNDFLIVKLDGSGQQMWRANEGDDDRQSALLSLIDVDSSGNALIAARPLVGQMTGYLLTKVDPTGGTLWRFTANSGQLNGFRLSEAGSAFLVGSGAVVSNGTFGDGFDVIKVNSAGEQQWRTTYPVQQNGAVDGATAIGFDSIGNIFVTGYMADQLETNRFQTIKLRPDGSVAWRSLSSEGRSFASGISVDADGTSAVVGTASKAASGAPGILVVKIDPDGVELWRRSFAAKDDTRAQVRSDSLRNLYVAATAPGQSTNDIFVVKLDPSGNELWRHYLDGVDQGEDRFSAMALDGQGNLVVTGVASRATGVNSTMTVKMTAAGDVLWRAYERGNANLGVDVMDLAVDASGAIHVVGSAQEAGSRSATIAIKYDRDGVRLWQVESAPATSGTFDTFRSVVARSGMLYVAGNSQKDFFDVSVIATKMDGVSPNAPVLVQAVSRMSHGVAGVFDLPLNLSGSIFDALTIEPRSVQSFHRLVLSFDRAIQSLAGVDAIDANGAPVAIAGYSFNGNEINLSFANTPIKSRVRVRVVGVNGGNNYSLPIAFQIGNVGNSGSNTQPIDASRITASDISATKARGGQAGIPANPANFLFDFNVDGIVDARDTSIVRGKSGQRLN
jgi:hypothetical protein